MAFYGTKSNSVTHNEHSLFAKLDFTFSTELFRAEACDFSVKQIYNQ